MDFGRQSDLHTSEPHERALKPQRCQSASGENAGLTNAGRRLNTPVGRFIGSVGLNLTQRSPCIRDGDAFAFLAIGYQCCVLHVPDRRRKTIACYG